jgi:hypothetical protein
MLILERRGAFIKTIGLPLFGRGQSMVGQEARFREHLKLLKQAAHGLGSDVDVELHTVEKKIEKFPKVVGRDAEILAEDIEIDLLRAAVKINKGLKAIPGEIARGARALGRDAEELGRRTRKDVVKAEKAAKKGVKKEFAKAAGVETGKMSEWEYPSKKNT